MKNFLKIILLTMLVFIVVKVKAAVPSSGSSGYCGDGICDSAEQADPNLCPKDCTGTATATATPSASASSSTSANPTSTPQKTALPLVNIINKKDLLIDARDKVVIIGFETPMAGISVFSVTDLSGNPVKNLEIFDTTLDDGKGSARVNNSHFFYIDNLLPSTEYKIKIIVAGETDYFEYINIAIKTSNSKNSQGTSQIGDVGTTTVNDFSASYTTTSFLSNKVLSIDEFSNSCKNSGVARDLCDKAYQSYTGGAIDPNSQAAKNASTKSVKETLADTFFNNKIVFYGDIGLLALLLLLELIYLLKSRGSWGVVFDSKDKKPLQGAIVRVFLEENNKMLETKVTDADGRFSFLVKPGNFYLDVAKAEYRFPSKFITKRDDEFYNEMYRGEVLHIFKGSAVLNPNIPVDKVGETLEAMEESHKALSSFGKKFSYFMISKMRLILLVLSTILNVGFVIIAYVPPLMVIAILVGLVWLLEGYAILRKGYH